MPRHNWGEQLDGWRHGGVCVDVDREVEDNAPINDLRRHLTAVRILFALGPW